MIEIINNTLDLIFAPILALNPIFSILILTILMSLIFTISNKMFINQAILKQIKKESKEVQEKIKIARKNNNEKKINKLMKKTMELSNKQMKMTLKPMLITMPIILLVFAWIPTNYGNIAAPLENNTAEFEIDNITYNLTALEYNNENIPINFKDSLNNTKINLYDSIDIDDREFILLYDKKDEKETLTLEYLKIDLPFPLPIAGDSVGWLGFYILISLPATTILRIILGVE